MELPLVVGVDGTDAGLTAVDWAVDEAARHGLALRLVHASLWERYEGAAPRGSAERPVEQIMAEHMVGSAAERAQRRHADVRVCTGILPQDPVSALLGEGSNASALVTGCGGRGRLKGLLVGSVSLAVAGRAPCPVIVVRGDPVGLAGGHERILLGLGDPGSGGEAVRFAFREAETRRCVLHVVRAWRSPVHWAPGRPRATGKAAPDAEERATAVLEGLLRDATAEHPDVRVRPAAVEGPAHKVLVDRSAAADLVIIGARRRADHSGPRLGRTSHTLLHHAQCPVAVVPQRV
jgi:nucleotide-binding universal stress UspA family protein